MGPAIKAVGGRAARGDGDERKRDSQGGPSEFARRGEGREGARQGDGPAGFFAFRGVVFGQAR
jgi:hypothetical protein